jgi:hypothetical protein
MLFKALHHRVFCRPHFFNLLNKFQCLDKILFPNVNFHVVTRISKVKITIERYCKRLKFIINDSDWSQLNHVIKSTLNFYGRILNNLFTFASFITFMTL